MTGGGKKTNSEDERYDTCEGIRLLLSFGTPVSGAEKNLAGKAKKQSSIIWLFAV